MKTLNARIHSKTNRPIKIMQFGEGNFLRAFVDWIIQSMNNTKKFNSNVVVVQPLPQGRVLDLKKQDGLYTLFLEGIEKGKIVKKSCIIDCLADFINPYSDYDYYLNYAKSKDLKYIISNTTEAGIYLEPEDLDLSKTPKSFPGKLLALLKQRYDYFSGSKEAGLHIIPCELIDYNGNQLKKVLVELSKLNKLSNEFIQWLENDNYYYNTLVDRIVPGYPKDNKEELQASLGYLDTSMVKGEIFHLWVIEDHYGLSHDFPAKAANLNVKFVSDFTPYKERKVKILNGSHTCMTPIGYLAGIDNVKDTINDEVIGKFVKEFIFEEVVPTINLPHDDMVSFANSVLERYQNPFIHHELLSIALNSVTKYKTRVLPSVIYNLQKLNKFPKRGLFALASLIVFYRGKRNEEIIPLVDNAEFLELFNELWSKYDGEITSVRNIATTVLGLEGHWGVNLNVFSNVTDYITNCIYDILTKDMKEVILNL